MTLTITSYYICALFRAEVDGQAALKGHIESVHLEDLFKFPCGICGFKAEGPKYLREHLAKEHDVDNVLSMVTVALEDWEISHSRGRQHVGVGRGGTSFYTKSCSSPQ